MFFTMNDMQCSWNHSLLKIVTSIYYGQQNKILPIVLTHFSDICIIHYDTCIIKIKKKFSWEFLLCTVWEYIQRLALQGVQCKLYNHICVENANTQLLDSCLYHNTYIWDRKDYRENEETYNIELCILK